MTIYSTINYLLAQGEKDGKQRGLEDGACKQLAKLLLRQGKRQFGPPSDEQRDLLQTLADQLDQAQLESLQERFLTAANWAELLEGAVSAGPAPAQPEYLLPYEFDPTPMPPSIDTYAQVTLADGMKAVMHMRFQRMYQKDLGAILHKESEKLREKYGGAVQSLVLLLWPGADGPALTGEWRMPSGEDFTYHVTRLWERDVDEMFRGPGTIAMAPLARFDPARLPEIVRRMEEAIAAQPDAKTRENLWSVAYQSMGLRFPAEQVNQLLAHVLPKLYEHKDFKGTLSTGYYEGFSAGQSEGAVRATLRWVMSLGSRRLGEPEPKLAQALEAIQGLERLEQLAGRVCKAATWQEVLARN